MAVSELRVGPFRTFWRPSLKKDVTMAPACRQDGFYVHNDPFYVHLRPFYVLFCHFRLSGRPFSDSSLNKSALRTGIWPK